MPIEDIHDSALNECLGLIYIAVDVPHGMVNQSSVHEGVKDCTHPVPRVDLWHHLQTMTILRTIGQKKRGGGGSRRSSTTPPKPGYLHQPSPHNYFVRYVRRCRRHPTE
jgi:hypothetical protein